MLTAGQVLLWTYILLQTHWILTFFVNRYCLILRGNCGQLLSVAHKSVTCRSWQENNERGIGAFPVMLAFLH